MDKIKNLGWPYNLYSDITGMSVPDTEYMKTRLYRYKYQRGYYCFLMMQPYTAHELMCQYLSAGLNEIYYTPLHTYESIIKKTFIYITLLNIYAYNKSYDETLHMFYNDFESFISCISYSKKPIPVLEYDIKSRDEYKGYTKQKLFKEVMNTLRSLRKVSLFNQCFLSMGVWSLAGLPISTITECLTIDDRIRLRLKNNKPYITRYFSINCRQFYDKGLRFDTEIGCIIKDTRIASFLNRYNMDTITNFLKSFDISFASRMYQHDISFVFKCLKDNGIYIQNEFYEKCIQQSLIEKVSKKKFSKRIVHEVKFVTTITPKENKKDGDKKQSIDSETDDKLKNAIDRIKWQNANKEWYRETVKKMLKDIDNERNNAYYSDIVFYIDHLITFIRKIADMPKASGYINYDPYNDCGFIDNDNVYINVSGIYHDICKMYYDKFGYEFLLSEERVYNMLVKYGVIDRVHIDISGRSKESRKYRMTYKTAFIISEDSLNEFRNSLIQSGLDTPINIWHNYKADHNYHRGDKPEYIDTFGRNATLRDVEDYYGSTSYIGSDFFEEDHHDIPEHIDGNFLSSLGIYCDLVQYDQ